METEYKLLYFVQPPPRESATEFIELQRLVNKRAYYRWTDAEENLIKAIFTKYVCQFEPESVLDKVIIGSKKCNHRTINECINKLSYVCGRSFGSIVRVLKKKRLVYFDIMKYQTKIHYRIFQQI